MMTGYRTAFIRALNSKMCTSISGDILFPFKLCCKSYSGCAVFVSPVMNLG